MRSSRFAIPALLAVGALVLYALTGSVLLAALMLVGAGVVWFRRQRSTDGAAAAAAAEPQEEEAPEWVASTRRLVRLDFELRERGAPDRSAAAVEEAIDRMRALLPELGTEHVGTELTWTVNRMAGDYLPRIVDPFLRLSPAEREQREDELLKSIEGLRAELENVEEIVAGRRVADFQTKAAFLRARFLDPT